MVVERLVRPVVHDHREVEIVRADDGPLAVGLVLALEPFLDVPPAGDALRGALIQRERRAARGSGHAFLESGAHYVELPGIRGQIHSAERGGRVHVEQRIVGAAQLAERLQRLGHRGGGIAVADRDQHRPVLRNFRLQPLGGKNAAPFDFDRAHIGAAALRDLDLQVPEPAEDRHQHPVAGLDQRHERRFDRRARRAVDEQRPAIFGLEHAAIELRHLLHVGAELRVELAQQRGAHGAQYPRIGIDRPRSHEQARRGIQVFEELSHGDGV
jgi:hypothetical protein